MFKKNLLIILILIYIISGLYVIKGQNQWNNYVRLHIIADSNSNHDQNMKLLLKNKLFEKYNNNFKNFNSKNEVISFFKNNKIEIENFLNDYLSKTGYNKKVNVYIKKEIFKSVNILPERKYDAIKIVIGKGQGHNFFTVLYPPLNIYNNLTIKEAPDDASSKIKYKSKIVEIIKNIIK